MPYNRSPFYQPKQDTGWGLIYRLNGLLGKIEMDIEKGDLESWNLHLDRVFANILYKNPEVVTFEKGKPADINFLSEDIEVFTRFNNNIEQLKERTNKIKNDETIRDDFKKIELYKLRKDYYTLLFKKDIWMRKKMFKMKLYLTQIEHDPRKAIYGG